MWDIKYRPLRFTDVVGQQGAVEVLKARLKKGAGLDTSYIFSGGHGQGKTTLARILARALLCSELTSESEPCNQCENCVAILNQVSQAFTEKNAASEGTIEHVRKIVADLPFAVQGAKSRVYLFDEVHRMSRDSQDVLLKPIEDKEMVAILCTTEAEKIRGPIRSRCEEHKIRRVRREDILVRLKWVLEQEGVESEDDAVLMVIDHSHGHIRDAINKIEMVAQLGAVTVQAVREHLNLSVVSTYYETLLSLGDPRMAIPLIESACDQVGADAVYEGLAEAAMNSYRMAKNMFADFTYVDRALAGKVHESYGDSLPQLAAYFLRGGRSTRMSLICDVLTCTGGVPATTTQDVVVMIQAAPAAAPVLASVPASSLPPAGSAPVEPLPPAPPEAVIPATPVAEATKIALVDAPSSPAVQRHTGLAVTIGNKGSDDPRALTSLDKDAIPLEHPRRPDSINRSSKPKSNNSTFLTAAEWRQLFDQRCLVLGLKGG
jgi:DNA polymerase III subunit gamma/tau